ncbi:hypothetical protein DMI65_19835 [Escherichia coli]|nr:hypothetical protein [Escherichia coli]
MPTGTTNWQGWLKWQQKIITNVSGIAHLLVGLDSVIADIAQIFPAQNKVVSMQSEMAQFIDAAQLSKDNQKGLMQIKRIKTGNSDYFRFRYHAQSCG